MENNGKKTEYLNEENYNRSQKKLKKIALIVLIVGILIGGSLIAAGFISQNNAKKTNEERYNKAYKESQSQVDVANKRLTAIETEITDLNSQIEAKQYECNSLDMKSSSWFADKNKCQSGVTSLKSKLSNLEMEKFELENADYTVYYDEVLPIKYIIFYFIGAGIIIASCVIALIIYIIAKRRDIRAFAIQQTMPVTQEAIGKMAPTVGDAVGTIGKDIAKGIASGIKEGTKEEDKK